MAKKRKTLEIDPDTIQGTKHLRKVFRLFDGLAEVGCERDSAGNRELFFSQYAALVLLGLFNPMLQSLNALSEASGLRKVQKLLGGPKASVGSLSESVRIFDPKHLEAIFLEMLAGLPAVPSHSRHDSIPDELVRRLTAVDGSALRALPAIVAGVQSGSGKWRMHLQFEVWREIPQGMVLTEDEVGGEADERSVLARTLQPGRIYILDRGYERYRLFEKIPQNGSDYVCRVQRRPMDVVTSQPLSREAREAGIVSDEIVALGHSRSEVGEVTHSVRRLVIAGGGPGRHRTDRPKSDEIILLTSLVDLPAEQVAAMYRLRWSIELFFRFLKHVLGCRHLLSHKPNGIAIQIYCALIAALLLSRLLGHSVGRRGFELTCLYLQGWAEPDEVLAGLARLRRAKTNG
jgi:Transposase DDE domain